MSVVPDPLPFSPNGAKYTLWIVRDDGARLATITLQASQPRPGSTNSEKGSIPVTAEIGFFGGQATGAATANTVVQFSYTEILNNVGRFRLVLPGDFDRNVLRKDNRLVIWRKPPGGARYLAFMGFIRRMQTRIDSQGNMTRIVSGFDLNELLLRRVIAYYAGHARAEQSDQADDLLKNFVDENLGASATTGGGRKTTANISSTYFSVEADAAAGVSQTKAASYRLLLDVLREVSDAARADGTQVYFGIAPVDANSFQFRTRTGQWGRDRTTSAGNGLIFSLARGNLAGPAELDEDATEEINSAFSLGQGEGAEREIVNVQDAARVGASIFATREGKIDARQFSTTAGVTDAANALLVKGRPRTSFTAQLRSVAGSIYGKDWNFGDKVPIDYDGRQFDALVRAVTVNVDEQGRESLDTLVEPLL